MLWICCLLCVCVCVCPAPGGGAQEEIPQEEAAVEGTTSSFWLQLFVHKSTKIERIYRNWSDSPDALMFWRF